MERPLDDADHGRRLAPPAESARVQAGDEGGDAANAVVQLVQAGHAGQGDVDRVPGPVPDRRPGVDRDEPAGRAAVEDVGQVQVPVHEPVVVGAGGQLARERVAARHQVRRHEPANVRIARPPGDEAVDELHALRA